MLHRVGCYTLTVDGSQLESVRRHTHMLGTVIDIRLRGDDVAALDVAERGIVDEIVRLEGVFSVFDEESELSRWKRGALPQPSQDFIEVMTAALDWQHRSNGAFNPLSGVLSQRWQRAASSGETPPMNELRRLARSISEPRFEVKDGHVQSIGDCNAINLNAIAKGFIVDRVCAATIESTGVSMVLVSAGGDMAHRGAPSVPVGIENPLRPYDNEPPLVVIGLGEAGLATSGGARRGFRVGTRSFSHVIDPRTGSPVDAQASISVVAPSAMEADVLATTLGMSSPSEAAHASEAYPGCACLVIGADGSRVANASWVAAYGNPDPLPISE